MGSFLELAFAWVLLHTVDFGLTIHTARLIRARSPAGHSPGTYELNPLFRADVDRASYLSRRFLISLLLPIPLFALIAFLAPATAGAMTDAPGWVLGGIVFSRLAVISGHLQNIIVTRPRPPGSPALTARLQVVGAIRHLTLALLLVLAALWRGPELVGGVTVLVLLGLLYLYRGVRRWWG